MYTAADIRFDPIVTDGPPPPPPIVTPLTVVLPVTDAVYVIFEEYCGWNADPHDSDTILYDRPYVRFVGGLANTYAEADETGALDTPLINEYTFNIAVVPYGIEAAPVVKTPLLTYVPLLIE